MAYTTIPDADLLPGKPIKASSGVALRDNPLAIASHVDSGGNAPRVWVDMVSSAIASDAPAGSIFRVSSDASPDGHGRLAYAEAPSVVDEVQFSIFSFALYTGSGALYSAERAIWTVGSTTKNEWKVSGTLTDSGNDYRFNVVGYYDEAATEYKFFYCLTYGTITPISGGASINDDNAYATIFAQGSQTLKGKVRRTGAVVYLTLNTDFSGITIDKESCVIEWRST